MGEFSPAFDLSDVIFSFVVAAASGNDLLEFPILRGKYTDGDLVGVPLPGETRSPTDDTRTEALPVAAEMLSLAT